MDAPNEPSQQPPAPAYSLRQLVGYVLKLGTLGFGGPVALVGYMHRDLVEDRRWISEADYKEGLALAQLAPGPLAAQLAIYLGYVHYRILGATLVGVAFVLPSFLMVVALGAAYVAYGGLPWMQAVFYGVGASVIGIIAVSAWKLTARNIGADKLLWAIYLAAAGTTIATESEFVWIFLVSGVTVWLVRAPPKKSFGSGAAAFAAQLPVASTMAAAVDWPQLAQIALYFGEAGAFVFGSGLAIVPFLYGGVVNEHHWLNERQFIDAVAVAMITPGPVVITVGFIGYLVQGFAGAAVAALATFLPCYLFTIIPAPYFKKYGRRAGIVAFVDGVTAAAIGTIAGAVVVLGQRSIVDIPTLVLALATAALVAKIKKIPEPAIVLAAALAGLVVFPFTKGHANMQTHSIAGTAEILVYSGGAPRAALKLFAPEFERASGHKLALTFDGVAPLRQRLAAGEKTDIILLPVPMLAAMEQAGALRPGSRIALARSGLGVVVREGAALPDVSNPEAVRKALLAARSIAYSDPKLAPSGVHLQRVFAQMGIADALRPKTTLRTPFDGGVELVAKGEAEIGVYLVSEIQMVQGVKLAGLLPVELQDYAMYAGAVAKDSAVPEAALAFLRFLSDPARRDHWKAAGFEPAGGAD